MKTAEEWTKEHFGPWTVNGFVSSSLEMGAGTFQEIAAEIQADALKQAAKIAEGCIDCQLAILTYATTLTIDQLPK